MNDDNKWALVVPMANEEPDFQPFTDALLKVLDRLKSGTVYFVVDDVSRDNTLKLCSELSKKDARFKTVWAPENRNVVDAYLRGFREALGNGHDYIIEMDAGLSHDPNTIPDFITALNEGNECVFGSRFIDGGSMTDSPYFRRVLSKYGTLASNLMLGTTLFDMTSGFQGFHANVVKKLVDYPLLSKAHFYQTEARYLLRKHRFIEVPIHYRSPSPRVSNRAIYNSLLVLTFYAWMRFTFNAKYIK